uniref:Pyrin domain-containing protein n=1 Tax=Gopherus agassizii TaxID=38772 RepID=A0A452HPR5_9SAUR
MPKTVRDHLLSTLANLGEAQLKNFKSKLNEIPLQDSYDNIPKGVLEKAHPIELTDKMIQSYRESYAVVVAADQQPRAQGLFKGQRAPLLLLPQPFK